MRKLLLLFLITLLFSTTLHAQTWTRMQSWGLDLHAIEWVNDSIGFSVGENLIIRTNDRGVSWKEVDIQFEGKLLDIAFLDEKSGFAVGENGLIFATNDSGKTWVKKQASTNNTLTSISIISENKLLIAGEGGLILSSSDQGDSWKPINSGTSLILNDISSINSDTLYIAGNQGLILFSENGGVNWNKLNSGISANLKGISFSTSLIGYAVGAEGTVIKTLDAGQTWSIQKSGVTTTLNKVAISPLDIRLITVVGDSAVALRSTNSAQTFGKANLGKNNYRNLYGLDYRGKSNQVSSVGQNGYFLNSGNAGASYSQLLAGSRNDYSGADFKSDRVGYTIGNKGSVVLTTNGGISTVYRPIPEELDLIGFDFWNNGFGYVGAKSGRMFRTGNSAASWVDVSAPTTSDITGFYLFAPSVLYVTGTDGYISSSFDSGVTWAERKESNTSEDLRDLAFFDYQFGFAIGNKGEILWSNGGTVWENLPNLTDENLNGLAKLDSTTAIVVGNKGVILRGTEKAKVWERIESGYTENFNSVDFWDENLGFISGDNGITLQTKDGGKTWIKIPTGTRRNLNGISVGNPLVVFASGDDGTLLKYICTTPIELGEISGNQASCLTTNQYSIPDTGIEGVQIVWRVDGGKITSGQGTHQIEVLWSSVGRNGVYVSNQNFCGNGRTSSMEVQVSQIASSEFQIQGQGSVCQDQTFSYNLPSSDGVTYSWSSEGGEILQGQGTSEVSIKWTKYGNTTLSVIQENSCGKSEPILLPITIQATPDKPGEINGLAQVGLWEVEYSLADQVEMNYIWEISDQSGIIVSGQGSNTIKVLWQNEGDFQLSVRNENNCGEGEARILAVNVNVITAIPEKANHSIKLYPNPSSGSARLEFGENKWTNLRVINSLGQEIQAFEIPIHSNSYYLEKLPTGLLFIQLESNSELVTKKLVVK